MRPKIEIHFSPNSSYQFIRTMAQVYKSDISLTFTVAMVTIFSVFGSKGGHFSPLMHVPLLDAHFLDIIM